MKTNIIQLENTYSYYIFYNKFINNTVPKLPKTPTILSITNYKPYINVLYAYYFKFLLLIDQMHDFTEKNNRNMWYLTNGSYKKKSQNIKKKLMEQLNIDTKFISTSLLTTYQRNILNNDIKNVFESSNNINTGELKDNIYGKNKYETARKILKLFGIVDFNIKDYLTQTFPNVGLKCSKNYDTLLSLFKLRDSYLSDSYKITSDNIILCIDAQKSMYNLSNIANMVCDVKNTRGFKGKIIFRTDLSNYYDSASKSSLSKIIKYFENENIIISNDETYNKFDIKINNLVLMSYSYVKKQNDVKLEIYQMFQLNNFKKLNKLFDNTNTSVSQLTTLIPPNSKELKEALYYKTLGDIGQILSFYNYTNNLKTYNYFITFDKVCSYISSLFNPYTILENVSQLNFPLNIFIQETMYDNLNAAGLLTSIQYNNDEDNDVNNGDNDNDDDNNNNDDNNGDNDNNDDNNYDDNQRKRIADIMLDLGKDNKKKRLEYGKQNKLYSFINIPKKYKHKIYELIILAKKYSISLDKNTFYNLHNLYIAQKNAKKLKINITKKNKNNIRIYKTYDELNNKIKQIKS